MDGGAAAVDLVIGMCGGYGAPEVTPFLRSLRASGFAGETVLLLHGNPPGTAAAVAALGAVPVAVDLAEVPARWSYNVARYAALGAYLAGRADLAGVVVTDVRDVVFQRDPAALVRGGGLHLFLEHPSRPVGACIWTSSWLRYRYGDAALPPLADRPIICSGVAVGAAAVVRRYLARVAAELDPRLEATHYMAGYDQGVVNQLGHTGRLPDLTVHPYATSPVLHLGNTPAAALPPDDGGPVRNPAGAIVTIVHQHDRHPALAARLAARWDAPR
jgi:hypothetical protein